MKEQQPGETGLPCGERRRGSLSGVIVCNLPAGHGGEWHEQHITHGDGSVVFVARFPVKAAPSGRSADAV